MEQIGHSLIDSEGREVCYWGDAPGQIHGAPDLIVLPDRQVHSPALNADYAGHKIVQRWLQYGAEEGITFDGSKVIVTRREPVPEVISDSQFFLLLLDEGMISEEEALAAVANGALPVELQKFVNSVSNDRKFSSKMLFQGATQFGLKTALLDNFFTYLGWSAAKVGECWLKASKRT